MSDVVPEHIKIIGIRYLSTIHEDHWITLYRKRRETLLKDEFGIEVEASVAKWEGIMDRYIDNFIIPKMTNKDKMAIIRYSNSVLVKNPSGCLGFFLGETSSPNQITIEDSIRCIFKVFMDENLVNNKQVIEAKLDGARPDDGFAYEHFCVSKFQEAGWNSKVTQATSDQGCDLIAEKGIVKLIVQCKLYSSPVGNKAVQEVAGAIRHYGGTHGAVVTNSSFTPSAKALARTNSIHLLHDSEIASLYDIMIGNTQLRESEFSNISNQNTYENNTEPDVNITKTNPNLLHRSNSHHLINENF